jgi:hypothetical protein
MDNFYVELQKQIDESFKMIENEEYFDSSGMLY